MEGRKMEKLIGVIRFFCPSFFCHPMPCPRWSSLFLLGCAVPFELGCEPPRPDGRRGTSIRSACSLRHDSAGPENDVPVPLRSSLLCGSLLSAVTNSLYIGR